ncbi:hypothetical protein ACSSS7_005298 [Eimeria intestinalis]
MAQYSEPNSAFLGTAPAVGVEAPLKADAAAPFSGDDGALLISQRDVDSNNTRVVGRQQEKKASWSPSKPLAAALIALLVAAFVASLGAASGLLVARSRKGASPVAEPPSGQSSGIRMFISLQREESGFKKANVIVGVSAGRRERDLSSLFFFVCIVLLAFDFNLRIQSLQLNLSHHQMRSHSRGLFPLRQRGARMRCRCLRCPKVEEEPSEGLPEEVEEEQRQPVVKPSGEEEPGVGQPEVRPEKEEEPVIRPSDDGAREQPKEVSEEGEKGEEPQAAPAVVRRRRESVGSITSDMLGEGFELPDYYEDEEVGDADYWIENDLYTLSDSEDEEILQGIKRFEEILWHDQLLRDAEELVENLPLVKAAKEKAERLLGLPTLVEEDETPSPPAAVRQVKDTSPQNLKSYHLLW